MGVKGIDGEDRFGIISYCSRISGLLSGWGVEGERRSFISSWTIIVPIYLRYWGIWLAGNGDGGCEANWCLERMFWLAFREREIVKKCEERRRRGQFLADFLLLWNIETVEWLEDKVGLCEGKQGLRKQIGVENWGMWREKLKVFILVLFEWLKNYYGRSMKEDGEAFMFLWVLLVPEYSLI